jgi:hypothetical protein
VKVTVGAEEKLAPGFDIKSCLTSVTNSAVALAFEPPPSVKVTVGVEE